MRRKTKVNPIKKSGMLTNQIKIQPLCFLQHKKKNCPSLSSNTLKQYERNDMHENK